MMKKYMRDTRVEIDTDKLRHNYRTLKKYLNEGTEIAAVIKANGYGHDALEVAEIFYDEGAKYLAVANFGEGMELKVKDPSIPVLVMGYTQDNQIEKSVKLSLTMTIFDLKQAKLIDEYSEKHRVISEVHIKVNTGFNRLGLPVTDQSKEIIEKIVSLKNIRVKGIFTHLALTGKEEDAKQYDLFKCFIAGLKGKGIEIPIEHVCDSLGAIRYPEYHMGMVRAGALLYGYYNGDCPVELKPAMELKSRISTINTVEAGEGVSYDYMYRVERKSKIALVPIGYADGYPRNLWKQGEVVIRGQRAPIAGIICMDQLMVDVTDIPEVESGDDVTLFGEGISLEEVSKLAGTNKNDIIASISRRVPRVYLEDKEIIKIKDYLIGEWEA